MLSMQRITSSSSDIASSTAEDGGKATATIPISNLMGTSC